MLTAREVTDVQIEPDAAAAAYLGVRAMGYTVKAAPDMVAFGISGIGDVALAFAQNAKKLSDYYRLLDLGSFPIERGYVLDPDDDVRRFVIQSIMCNFRLGFAELRARFGVDFASYFAAQDRKLRETIEPSFFERTADELRVTPAGRLFVRNICMVFDRYLDRPAGEQPLYSRTV